MTIKEIEILVKQKDLTTETITALTNDTRSAVQRLFRKWEREQNEMQRVDALYKYEYKFQKQGIEYIAGVDEAGRGPLAGPVFVAAVILPIGLYIPKINDSKKISAKVRESIYELLLQEGIGKRNDWKMKLLNIFSLGSMRDACFRQFATVAKPV